MPDDEATREKPVRRPLAGWLNWPRRARGAAPSAESQDGPVVLARLAGPIERAFSVASGFLRSRLWLAGALGVTVVLLGLVLATRPNRELPMTAPDEPDVVFDEIKTLPPAGTAPGSRPRPGGDENRGADGGRKSAARTAGLVLDSPLADADEPPPMRLSRHLDAVRWRQARGAWLTGTIEAVADAVPLQPTGPHAKLIEQTSARAARRR